MKKMSLVNYDSESDMLYIVIKKGPEETVVEVAPGINVELDEKGEIIGIEIPGHQNSSSLLLNHYISKCK